MFKNLFFTVKIMLSSAVILIALGAVGCDDDKTPNPVSNGGTDAGESAGEMSDPATCMTACQQLLRCAWFDMCSVTNLQSALNACFSSCTDEVVASELIADADLSCELSVVRTRSRFETVASCEPGNLCADQVCGEGFTCNPESGLCVNPCEGIMCDQGTTCVEGVCQGPCTDVVCPEGLGCFEGDCIDLCFGISCGDNEVCDPTSGQCLDQCSDVTCGRGERCNDGLCVPACSGVTCDEGEICNSTTGECVNLCENVRCRQGFECNPRTGRCGDICDATECVEGWVCDDGDCIFDDPCASVTCDANTICNPTTTRCELFVCTPDLFEGESRNNEISTATSLSSQTQRIDDLTICSFDLDWYALTVPANTSARLSLRFAHNAGDLIFRLYNNTNLLSPMIVSNTENDDEYIGIEPASEERRFYLRVSSGGGMFDQNRYSLVVEFDLPGVVCNDDSECLEAGACVNALCGGRGADNPNTDPDVVDPSDFMCNEENYEPDNSVEESTDLDAQNTQIWSAMICGDDQDFYTFQINELSDVEINVLFDHEQGDIDASLLNLDSETIALGISTDDNEQISASALTPGQYFISVVGFGTIENRYELEVNVSSSNGDISECSNDDECLGDYICVMDACVAPEGYCNDLAVPNQEYMSAYPVQIPSVIDDLALCESDFYAIDLVEGQAVTIQVTFSNSSGEDLDMKLYRPNGTEARFSSGLTDVEEIAYTAEIAGVHTLEIYPYLDITNPMPFITRYTLSVSEGTSED